MVSEYLSKFKDPITMEKIFVQAYRGLPWVYLTAPEEDRQQAPNEQVAMNRLRRDAEERLAKPWLEDQHADMRQLLKDLAGPGPLETMWKVAEENYREPRPCPVIPGAPASEKQLNYLRVLGYRGTQTLTVGEARYLIDKLKKG